jgi:hypothetical protein
LVKGNDEMYIETDKTYAGLLPARLAWLTKPQQIERTLYLLFHLNHWAKARESLLYTDRQGLYKVKAALLQKAYESGLVHPCVYLDGSQSFACDFYFRLAPEMAAEVFLSGLSDLCEVLDSGTDESEWDKVARNLFKRITGYEVRNRADVESLNEGRVKIAIHRFLQELVAQACLTRQPIPTSNLDALYIEPLDLFELQGSRYRFSTCWDDLDESDARKLDPEGLSLIAFQYHSSTAQYTFHLPFRVVEIFLPKRIVDELRDTPGVSREGGVFYGRAITDAESERHPVREILRELMVDIVAICPHNLIDKQAYISQRPKRYSYWQDDEFDEYDDEEDIER